MSYYFTKATESALDVRYIIDGKEIVKSLKRGEILEFDGEFISATVPDGEAVPSPDGGAGMGYIQPEVVVDEPVVEEDGIVEETVVVDSTVVEEPVVAEAPKKRGRKSNAEKEAEAAAQSDAA